MFSLPGRTSLYQITEDICSKFGLKTAPLPSYCCDTVIEPFLRAGAEVRFYPVKATKSGIKAYLDTLNGADAVLTMGWFGFGVEERNSLEREVRDRFRGSVIIRDVTHTLFTEREVGGGECDYAFASLRKRTGFFGCRAILRSPEAMASHRDDNVRYGEKTEKAARMKKSFMAGGSSDKAEMLRLFSEPEDILDEDYGGYGPLKRDLTALKGLDERYISSRRRRNYSILYDNRSILEAKGIIPLTGPLNEEVPLFLPVLLKDAEERRRLRLYLIENRVFCPVHWHISHVHTLGNEEREIYDRELSIVCDQRYDAEDMERILYLVEKY